MKIILLLFFIISSTFSIGQSCTPVDFPTDIYYPNSTTTPTNVQGPEYLCGPNTIVYDTLGDGCHFVYVNSNSILFFKSACSCAAASYIWLKNNSVLNLTQGNCPLFVFYEPSAIINNPYSVTISSFSCSSISFPIVNCTATGIKENNLSNNDFELYPNPANEIINLKLEIKDNEKLTAEILNNLGQVIREENVKNNSIDIKNLPNGIYSLNLISEMSGTVSKRFVVAH